MRDEAQIVIPGTLPEPTAYERDRKWEVDRTPRPVVRMLVRELIGRLTARPRGCADVFAGSGVWADELIAAVIDRFGAPPDMVLVLEARPEERPHLERLRVRWGECVRILIADVHEIERVGVRWDVIVGNPAFSGIVEIIPLLAEQLEVDGWLALFYHNALGQRGTRSSDLFLYCAPDEHWRVPGSIGFRGDSKSDARDYGLWIFRWPCLHELYELDWRTINLPRLPSSQRRWLIPPGRELEGVPPKCDCPTCPECSAPCGSSRCSETDRPLPGTQLECLACGHRWDSTPSERWLAERADAAADQPDEEPDVCRACPECGQEFHSSTIVGQVVLGAGEDSECPACGERLVEVDP